MISMETCAAVAATVTSAADTEANNIEVEDLNEDDDLTIQKERLKSFKDEPPEEEEEEEVDNSPPETPVSSPPLLPIRPTAHQPLFQPFLPVPSLQNRPVVEKPLPFSIDNILRPTFGRRLLAPLLGNSFAVAAAAAAAVAAAASQQNHVPSSPALSTTSSTSSTYIKREPKSPSSNSNNNNNNQPVDLSKGGNNNSSSGDEDSPLKRDDDCPPGMVRGPNGQLWPAWVFCTRYSDRPSSGPRSRRLKKATVEKVSSPASGGEKRPRTAFSSDQLARLKKEFDDNRYLTEERRRNLATELGLNENQIKIWFQNKRAKIKKSTGQKGELAQMLMAQGLYNHSTVPVDEEDNPLY